MASIQRHGDEHKNSNYLFNFIFGQLKLDKTFEWMYRFARGGIHAGKQLPQRITQHGTPQHALANTVCREQNMEILLLSLSKTFCKGIWVDI